LGLPTPHTTVFSCFRLSSSGRRMPLIRLPSQWPGRRISRAALPIGDCQLPAPTAFPPRDPLSFSALRSTSPIPSTIGLSMPVNGTAFGLATRVLGQDQMNFNAPNLVEGREFAFSSLSGTADAGLAVDLTSSPPHLYVADTYNNRILGYTDLRNFKSGAKADLVI